QGAEPSLLARLSDEILVLKDFGTVLEMPRTERQAILAQLREIFDGRFDDAWGSGKEFHWEGRLGLLAGVPPVVDQHHAAMGLLGPRFVQLRVVQPNRQEVGIKAMSNVDVGAMRAELADAAASFLAGLPTEPPVVDD